MLQLNGSFQPAEDKAIGKFVAMLRGFAGTGKSSLLGSAYLAGHPILVGDVENKGWGKYPRFVPPNPADFNQWMDMILDILYQPLESDGMAHLVIDGHEMAINTLGLDTLDRLQDIGAASLGAMGSDTRKYYQRLYGLFKPFLQAVDDTALNVIIATHIRERTPTIAESSKEEQKLLGEARKKSNDAIDITDLNVADLGIGIYDYAATSLVGALGGKIDDHMHEILNVIRSPEGESILAATDVKVNGVWFPSKDDFGLFKRQNISLQWHQTEALILNDPLGILWDATKGRERLIAAATQELSSQKPNAGKTANDTKSPARDEAACTAMENKVNEGISRFITEFSMTEDEWADVLNRYPIKSTDTLDDILGKGLATLKQLSNVVIKHEVAARGIAGANEILAPMIDAIIKATNPKDIFRLTEEGLALLELAAESAPEMVFENVDAIAF